MLEALDGDRPDLLVCFATPHYSGVLEDVTGGLRKLVEPDVLVGGIFSGVSGSTTGREGGAALSVFAVSLGGGHATAMHLEAHREDDGTTITGWPEDASSSGTLLLLTDGATFPIEGFLAMANCGLPGLDVTGGVGTGTTAGDGLLALDDRVIGGGAVGVLLDPTVQVRTLVSQASRPVGQPFTVTRSDGKRIIELAGRPALERLREVAAAVAGRGIAADDGTMSRGLQVGVVVDEHKTDLRRGDFVVRGLLGIDDLEGSLSVGAPVQVGRTVQFQVSDPVSTGDDLRKLLSRTGGRPGGALLFVDAASNHRHGDPGAATLESPTIQAVSGALPMAGAFCASAIGPAGGRSELHASAASLLLFD